MCIYIWIKGQAFQEKSVCPRRELATYINTDPSNKLFHVQPYAQITFFTSPSCTKMFIKPC